ncbi:MAG: adenine phosphoribosyltransferase [Pseudomonadota bacterium]
MDLRAAIRTIPDHPKPGIMFRDVTTLMGDAAALKHAVGQLSEPFLDARVTKVAGIEARGFVFGAPVAERLQAGFVPLRKKGKLPSATYFESYELEYGIDELHMHEDAVKPGERVLIVDDLIATGGTAEAGVKLVRRGGGEVVGASFVVDLPELGGADRLRELDVAVHCLTAYEGH